MADSLDSDKSTAKNQKKWKEKGSEWLQFWETCSEYFHKAEEGKKPDESALVCSRDMYNTKKYIYKKQNHEVRIISHNQNRVL